MRFSCAVISFFLFVGISFVQGAVAVTEQDIKDALKPFLQAKQLPVEDLQFKQLVFFSLTFEAQGVKLEKTKTGNAPLTLLVYKKNQPIGVFHAILEQGKLAGNSFGFEELSKQFDAVFKQFPDQHITFFTFTGRPLYGFMMGGKGAEKPTLTTFESVKDWNNIRPLPYNEGLEELSKWKDYKGGAQLAEPIKNE